MSSGPKSWLPELDQCIAVSGGAAQLASSKASSDRAVITLRNALAEHFISHSDANLPTDFGTEIPVCLSAWVPSRRTSELLLQVHRLPDGLRSFRNGQSSPELESSTWRQSWQKQKMMRLQAERARALSMKRLKKCSTGCNGQDLSKRRPNHMLEVLPMHLASRSSHMLTLLRAPITCHHHCHHRIQT